VLMADVFLVLSVWFVMSCWRAVFGPGENKNGRAGTTTRLGLVYCRTLGLNFGCVRISPMSSFGVQTEFLVSGSIL
jgi:hypothetical protein